MVFGIRLTQIPGTILERRQKGGLTGAAFVDSVFFPGDGIMLTQIREVAGIDGSTLQNWLKRGWVANPVNKLYTKDMLARILLINMMRDTMRLGEIGRVLTYVNGDADSKADDIISETKLYDYVCRLLDALESRTSEVQHEEFSAMIGEITADYAEAVPGAGRRLRAALEIIVVSYVASLVKRRAESLVKTLP